MNLQGKVAVLTGAARGVGRATALRLARLGCSTVINYRSSREEAERTAADVRALGVKALCHQGSVADDGTCRELVESAVRAFGRLDLLVNNAGTTRFVPLGDLEGVQDEDWAQIFSTNVKGSFQCARAARPHLEKSDLAMIVNVSSMAAYSANGSSIPYSASKAALLNLTVSLARALAPSIRVNAVAPGFIEGEWVRKNLGEQYEAKMREHAALASLGRICQPDDVAAAILSLVTGSRLVTGHTLLVDGGTSLNVH